METELVASKRNRKVLRIVQDGTHVSRKWSGVGYVEVPKEMLRQAGFGNGSKVMLYQDEMGQVKLLPALSDGDAEIQQNRLCLRLWRPALQRVGIRHNRPVDFTFKEGFIEVSQVSQG